MGILRARSGRTAEYNDYSYNLGTLTRQFVENHGLIDLPSEEHTRVTDAFHSDISPTRVRSGFAVPLDAMGSIRRRSLSLGNSVSLAPTKLPPVSDFTDVLRAKSVVGRLGGRFATYFNGSTPIQIPAKTSGAVATWIADGTSAPTSDLEFADDDAPGESQTLAACLILSRKLWNATDDEVHGWILDELSAGFSAEVDRAVIAGAGTLEPVGLLNLVGVPAGSFGANGGAPTRAKLVAAMRAVGNANGESSATASMGWLTSPDGEAKLRLTDGSSAGSGAWLWSDSDRVIGKPAVSTTSIPNDLTQGSGTGLTALAYGNWGDVLVNHARAVQINVDARSYLDGGAVRITAFLDVKVVFRHKASFYVFQDMSTS